MNADLPRRARARRVNADSKGLQARQMIAQGNALGLIVKMIPSPERAAEGFEANLILLRLEAAASFCQNGMMSLMPRDS